ncbi:MAG: LecA/PA-IL family lectin [Pyrinomonadaceae bacterium]
MLSKSNLFRLLSSVCLVFCLSFAALADTIRLKDGSVIKGTIVGFRDGKFQIQIGDGARQRQMTFFADEIDAIEFDSGSNMSRINTPPTNTVLPRPAYNPPTSARNTPANTTANTTPTNRPANTLPNDPIDVQTVQTANPTPIVPKPQPIQLNMKVLANDTANGWTNAGWVVKKGQKIKITGTGRISLGSGNYSTPGGLSSISDKDKLMQNQPTGGLIAVVGDDNNDFIFIGNSREFTATRDGALFLGINEGVLNDNSGSFEVKIEIDPGT